MGVFGAAVNFYLWVWALERTSPTRVANTKPIGLNLMLGIAAVACGIWVASTEPRSGRAGDSGSPGDPRTKKIEQGQGPARNS